MAFCCRLKSDQGIGLSLKNTQQDCRVCNPNPGSDSYCEARSSSRMSTAFLQDSTNTWWALGLSTVDSTSPHRPSSHLALTTHYHHRGANKAINSAADPLLNPQQDEDLISTCCSVYWDSKCYEKGSQSRWLLHYSSPEQSQRVNEQV